MQKQKITLLKTESEQKQRITFSADLTLGFDEVSHSTCTSTSKKGANYDLYRHDFSKPLLNRLCMCVPEFLLELLRQSDLQTILIFRSISMEFKYFASTTNKCYSYNPLVDKTTISFQYNQLHPDFNHPSVKEKWDFVTENEEEKMESQIIASPLDNLLKLKMTFIAKNNLKVVFEIGSNDELNQLQIFFSKQANSEFLNKLKKLDFSELFIDVNNINAFNAILATMSQSLDLLPSLTTLAIGEVCPTVTLQMPSSLENSKKIIYKLTDESSMFTLENFVKGAIVGLGAYSVYRYLFSKESTEDKKKDQQS